MAKKSKFNYFKAYEKLAGLSVRESELLHLRTPVAILTLWR